MIIPHFLKLILYAFGILLAFNVGVVFGAGWTRATRKELDRYTPGDDGIDNVVPLRRRG